MGTNMKTNLFIVIAILTSASFVEAKEKASKEECNKIVRDAADAYRPFTEEAISKFIEIQSLYVQVQCGSVEKINKRVSKYMEAQDRKYGRPAPPRGSDAHGDDENEVLDMTGYKPPQDFMDESISTSSSSVPTGEGHFYSSEDRNSTVTTVKPPRPQTTPASPASTVKRQGSK